MTSPVLHPQTRKDFDACVARSSHAVTIFGVDGVGKTYVAIHLAAALLGIPTKELAHNPYFRIFSPNEKGVLSLEQARDIVSFMKLKTVGKQEIRRVVIVEHAQMLTGEAQNALLKMIEEPPEDTIILLTAPSEESILPTIRSRTQKLQVRMPSKSHVIQYFKTQGYSDELLDRAYLVSGGLPGLCTALITGDQDHVLIRMIGVAKEILTLDTFSRLALVDTYSSRTDAENLVNAMGQIARSGLAGSVTKVNKTAATRWHSILAQIATAQMQLASSGAPKLVLANLFLHI